MICRTCMNTYEGWGLKAGAKCPTKGCDGTVTAAEVDRERAFHGTVTVWTEEDPDTEHQSDAWGEASDVAAAVLAAIEHDNVIGFVVAMTRGIPDDRPILPQEGDPR